MEYVSPPDIKIFAVIFTPEQEIISVSYIMISEGSNDRGFGSRRPLRIVNTPLTVQTKDDVEDISVDFGLSVCGISIFRAAGR